MFVDVGPVAFIYEFNPKKQSGEYDPNGRPSISIYFECALRDGEEPTLPDNPDPMQTDVCWVPLKDLDEIVIYPNLKNQVTDYFYKRRNIELIQDYMLNKYQ